MTALCDGDVLVVRAAYFLAYPEWSALYFYARMSSNDTVVYVLNQTPDLIIVSAYSLHLQTWCVCYVFMARFAFGMSSCLPSATSALVFRSSPTRAALLCVRRVDIVMTANDTRKVFTSVIRPLIWVCNVLLYAVQVVVWALYKRAWKRRTCRAWLGVRARCGRERGVALCTVRLLGYV